jgi:hypothetical protein
MTKNVQIQCYMTALCFGVRHLHLPQGDQRKDLKVTEMYYSSNYSPIAANVDLLFHKKVLLS